MRVSYAGSGQASWRVEGFSRVKRFSRNIAEREHSVLQSVMLVQGEPGGVEKFSRDMRVSIISNVTELEPEFWTV